MDDAPGGCLGSCFSLGCSIIGTVVSIVVGVVVVGLSIYLDSSSTEGAPSVEPEPSHEAPAPAPRKPRRER